MKKILLCINLHNTIAVLSSVLIFSLLYNCSKENEISPHHNIDKVEFNSKDVKTMNPGSDPVFINYVEDDNGLYRTIAPAPTATWERFMYVDNTDTIYRNAQGKNTFSKYLKTYGFTGVYLYSTNSILSSSSNYVSMASFLKQLSDSGITYRAVVKDKGTDYASGGSVTVYNNSQSDPAKKINRANLELEWWNNITPWLNWNAINQQVAAGTIADNDFYEGWYLNMGLTKDTIAARDQVLYSDRILLHCYQKGIPTYSYANAQSTGATCGRLDCIAKGARQANKKIDLYIIISSENTAWGAANTFSGPALASAYVGGATNPFLYIEQQAYNNINVNMTAFQKQWINFKGFVWFTKSYCYRAVPPR